MTSIYIRCEYCDVVTTCLEIKRCYSRMRFLKNMGLFIYALYESNTLRIAQTYHITRINLTFLC